MDGAVLSAKGITSTTVVADNHLRVAQVQIPICHHICPLAVFSVVFTRLPVIDWYSVIEFMDFSNGLATAGAGTAPHVGIQGLEVQASRLT